MNIILIQTFLNIVRLQSISGAAEAMYTSQPTVSMRLNQLEKELGVQLIKRKKGCHSVELTAHGRAFIPLAEYWMQLERRTQQFSQQTTGEPVIISAPTSLQEHLLPSVVRKLQNLGIDRFYLKSDASPKVYSAVANSEADLGLALRTFQKDGVVALPIFEGELMVLCPSNTMLPNEPISPSALNPNFEVRVNSWTGEIRRWHDQWWDPAAIPYMQVDNNYLSHNYLDRPECWTICPAVVCHSVVKSSQGKLTIRHLAVRAPKQVCYLVLPRSYQTTHSELVATVLRGVREYVDEMPWLQWLYSQQAREQQSDPQV